MAAAAANGSTNSTWRLTTDGILTATDNTRTVETGEGREKRKTSYVVGGGIDTSSYDYYEVKLTKMILYY